MITQSELKEKLLYSPKTGIFIWLKPPKIHMNKQGKEAGCKDSNGYIIITIDNKPYKSHRLAWLYVYGYFPENIIDHKDRIPYSNWIDNLRESSHSCNIKNASVLKNNTSGVKGVSLNKNKYNKWTVCISGTGYIGAFHHFIDAVKARWEAEKASGYLDCCTTSSAYLYLKGKGEENLD